MERQLLLLGLLRLQDMHGYQLNEAIDAHVGLSINLKKATAYDLLRKMEAEGWVSHHEEREGNRPPRRVYAITPDGEVAFQRMLRTGVAQYTPGEFPTAIPLAFLDELLPGEARTLLGKRRAAIAKQLDEIPPPDEHHPGSLGLIMEHQRRHLQTELNWVDELIDRYKER